MAEGSCVETEDIATGDYDDFVFDKLDEVEKRHWIRITDNLRRRETRLRNNAVEITSSLNVRQENLAVQHADAQNERPHNVISSRDIAAFVYKHGFVSSLSNKRIDLAAVCLIRKCASQPFTLENALICTRGEATSKACADRLIARCQAKCGARATKSQDTACAKRSLSDRDLESLEVESPPLKRHSLDRNTLPTGGQNHSMYPYSYGILHTADDTSIQKVVEWQP